MSSSNQQKPIDERYCIILDLYGYLFNVYIQEAKNLSYPGISPERILKHEARNLSKEQKELLEFIEKTDFWQKNIDFKKLFALLKNSGLRIYNNRRDESRLVDFNDSPSKINVQITKEKENKFWEHRKDTANFVFKLNEKYANSKKYKFLFSKNNFAVIENNTINVYEIPEKLTAIIRRASGDIVDVDCNNSVSDKKFFQTKLREKEIIQLNKILTDSKKYLNLKSSLKPNYKIVEFKNPKPIIVVDYDGDKALLKISPAVDYGFEKVKVDDSVYYSNSKMNSGIQRRNYEELGIDYLINAENNTIFYAHINAEMEKDLFREFYKNAEKYGFNKKGKFIKKGSKQILEFIKKNWQVIKSLEYELIFLNDELDFSEEDFKADFKVDFNKKGDLLSFDIDCYCGEDKIGLRDLRAYIDNKKDFMKTSDGKRLKVANPEELERFILMLESFHEKENGKFEGNLYHAPELDNIFTGSEYYQAKTSADFKKFMTEAKGGYSVKKIKLPPQLDKILREYQKEGLDWLYFLRQYRFAGILADDMGLGKTLQALALITMNRKDGAPSIVIAPKTLLYNWQDEVEKFTPELKTIVIDGSPTERKTKIGKVKKYDLIITSYPALQRDLLDYEKQKIKFNYCVLDEAQFIKNYKTKNAQTVKKISAEYRLALTGTPLENTVSELWSIFEFLMPGFLGSHRLFTERFQTPIMKNSDTEALRRLRKKTECFMLRRTKEKVLKELPPKIEQINHCHLADAQSILYQEILASVKKDIFDTVGEKGFARSQIHILAGLTKLRQICNHPALLLKGKDYTKYESAKLDVFLELIHEITSADRKVLVFSQFTTMLDILAKELHKNDVEYSYLSGKTKNRQEMVKEFNKNPKKQVFLISLKAGGTGLNLTSADNVIIFDPWWNPSVERQAIDRTHRIGQKNSVNVYRLITSGTIEEKIVALQDRKKFLFDNLVDESADLFKKLTWEDLKELFK